MPKPVRIQYDEDTGTEYRDSFGNATFSMPAGFETIVPDSTQIPAQAHALGYADGTEYTGAKAHPGWSEQSAKKAAKAREDAPPADEKPAEPPSAPENKR